MFRKNLGYGFSFFFIILMINSLLMVGMAQEVDLHLQDSDEDGISDWDEINRYESNPNSKDSDGDLIDDYREVTTGTSPMDPDSDGDGFPDFDEYGLWNPDAERIPDRWYRCPYIADLPELTTTVVDGRIERHYTFTKGNETRVTNITSTISQNTGTHGWRNRIEGTFSTWFKVGLELGAKTQIPFGPPTPHWKLVSEWGLRVGFDAGVSYSWSGTHMDQTTDHDQEIINDYTTKNWDMSTVTLHMELEISNSYAREVKMDKAVFDLLIGEKRFTSEEWVPDWVFRPGETHSRDISFTISGEEWIHAISYGGMELGVDEPSVELSVFDEAADSYVSEDTMSRRIWDRCVLVSIPNSEWGPIRKYICAIVDKLDGLNVLTALDRLFLPYTYRYGRLMNLMDIASKPGEEVWAFSYHSVWHDASTYSTETNMAEVNMWGRGALLLSLEKDTDGDWLIDYVEQRIGTSLTDPDTDGDYLDDYVEVVLARSSPFDIDTDKGGIIDGIEYYEGFDPTDPTDDKLKPPSWYQQHKTLKIAQQAANILLSHATQPSPDEITWPSPQSPGVDVFHSYQGQVSYVTNKTIRMGDDQTIVTIEIGDVDNDNISEIVYGTYPMGLVILLDDDDGDGQWQDTLLANFSYTYGVYPVWVMDLAIGDANNNLANGYEIVVGSCYYDGGYTGKVHMFYKSGDIWDSSPIDSSIDGGVYSIAIGDTCGWGENVVAVGQGGTESYVNSQVRVYSKVGPIWECTAVANTTSSRVHVTIGDIDDYYDGAELVFCTYGLNSTLSYIGYRHVTTSRTIVTIAKQLDFVGDPPPYEKYMCVEIGNVDDDDTLELIYAVDRTFIGTDSLWIYDPDYGNASILDNLEFHCPMIALNDFDNDGWDEAVFHVVDPAGFPDTNLSVIEWDGLSWKVTSIENATEPYVEAIAAGDVDTDGEMEVLYGTLGSGILRLWDHPKGALWPSEIHEWDVEITLSEPWIYEGDPYPINVTAINIGPYDMNDINVSIIVHENVVNATPPLQNIASIVPGANETCSFLFWPTTSGNYTVSVDISSFNPRVFHSSDYSLLVVPRIQQQAEIGRALLELALYTNNQTLLDAAVEVGKWLETVHIQFGSFYAWNGDPSYTDAIVPGFVLGTARTGLFFLKLFRATGDFDFLVDALDAASFLGDPYEGCWSLIDSVGLAWAPHDNGVAEAAEVGELLFEVNKELIYDYFAPTLSGVRAYLMFLAQNGTLTTSWLESCGITQTISRFFTVMEGTFLEAAQRAGNWLVEEIQNDPDWVGNLSVCYRPESPYDYYVDTGLAGLLDTLVLLSSAAETDCADEISQIADLIMSLSHMTNQGTNWRESSWPGDLETLVHSVDWDYGTAGIASALTAAYRATGNQTYLDCALDAADWMDNALTVFNAAEEMTNITSRALSDIIKSMIDIHSTLPVVFVGYFVDPMTSLSGATFNVSGYVQTMGWHAKDVNITLDLASAFRAHGQEKTIDIGTIAQPSGIVMDWIVTPLAYGEFNIGVIAESENAGTQTNNATVMVTDVGVTKLRESDIGFVALSLAQDPIDLYNLGETVWLPIEAEYHNGDPAINASIKVGAMGTAVVNEYGVAYIGVSSIAPGTIEIPIYIRYDKKTGITSGTDNLTVSLTFTGLEVYDVTSSAAISFTGEPITMSGYVRYAHDHSIVPSATVSLDGNPVAITDEAGFFQFQHTEGNPGLTNYTITADADADHRIVVCALSQQVQVEWMPFWTPITIGIAIVSVAAVVVVVTIIALKKKKISLPSRNRLKGIVNIRRKNPKK